MAVGASLVVSDASTGLAVDVRARTLVGHLGAQRYARKNDEVLEHTELWLHPKAQRMLAKRSLFVWMYTGPRNPKHSRRETAGMTNTKPRSMAALSEAIRALLTSSAAKEPEAAVTILELLAEAAPYRPVAWIDRIDGIVLTEGRLAVTAWMTTGDAQEREQQVQVHPTVAALYHFPGTVEALLTQLKACDRRADWPASATIGDALVKVLDVETVNGDAKKIRNAVQRVATGRLERAHPRLATRIRDAQSRRLALPVTLGKRTD